jgi:hypothetical protein
MEDQEQLFINGFNNGYLIAEHEPELAAQLIKVPNEHNEYFNGIVLGKQEFDMEKKRERLKGVTRNDVSTKDVTKDVTKDKGKDK